VVSHDIESMHAPDAGIKRRLARLSQNGSARSQRIPAPATRAIDAAPGSANNDASMGALGSAWLMATPSPPNTMKRFVHATVSAALSIVLAACTTLQPDGGLGGHKFKITTKSREAQRAFDRGLTWAYAFAYKAAEDEFRAAAAADPNCAMAWWGVALVNGPHINFPLVPPDKAKTAWDAITKAQALAPRTSKREQALIGALGKRYASPQPSNRSKLDVAYADAMRAVCRRIRRTRTWPRSMPSP
jgi:hypothetical protein